MMLYLFYIQIASNFISTVIFVSVSGNHQVLFIFLYICIGVFSESTSDALKLYSDGNLGFEDTAKYVQFICNIWKIMAVRTPNKGYCEA